MRNTRNKYGLKDSCDQYRNINGILLVCWTSDTGIIPDEIEKCKKLGIKYRVIKGEMYVESDRITR